MNKPKTRTNKKKRPARSNAANKNRSDAPDMKDWADFGDRIKAVQKFVLLPEKVLELCHGDSKTARDTFAALGPFYVQGQNPPTGALPWNSNMGIKQIPSTTTFHVYWRGDEYDADPNDFLKREKDVVLIAPYKDRPAETLTEDVVQYWRCTYTPYPTRLKSRKRRQDS